MEYSSFMVRVEPARFRARVILSRRRWQAVEVEAPEEDVDRDTCAGRGDPSVFFFEPCAASSGVDLKMRIDFLNRMYKTWNCSKYSVLYLFLYIFLLCGPKSNLRRRLDRCRCLARSTRATRFSSFSSHRASFTLSFTSSRLFLHQSFS